MARDWLRGIDKVYILTKTITMNKRFLITSLVSVALAFAGYAEEKTHVVERGETLTTIAKTYGVTEQALIKANPDAASFCYVGMVLTIPESANAEARSSESGGGNARPDSDPEKVVVYDTAKSDPDAGNTASRQDARTEVADEKSAESFSGMSFTYDAGYDSFKYGFYGIKYRLFGDKGLGVTLGWNMNYGLGGGSGEGQAFHFGPIYGYPLTKFFMINFEVAGDLSLLSVKNVKDMIIGGGVSGGPGVTFKFGNVLLGVDFMFGWNHSPSYKIEGLGETKASDSFTKGIRFNLGVHF